MIYVVVLLCPAIIAQLTTIMNVIIHFTSVKTHTQTTKSDALHLEMYFTTSHF